MEKSRILDDLVGQETRIRVDALSTNPRKPLSLDGTLLGYDEMGYLFRESPDNNAEEKEESFVYLPRESIASIRFTTDSNEFRSYESISQDNKHKVTYNEGNTYQESLRSFRAQAGLTKASMSRILGISISHINNSEGTCGSTGR